MGYIYEVYIDVLAINNFFADFAALAAVNFFMGRSVRVHRILAGAAAGTLGSCLSFAVCGNTGAYLLTVHFLLNPLVLYFCFRERTGNAFLTDLAISYCAFLFLGGIMEWLYAGGRGALPYGATLAVSAALFFALLRFSGRWLKSRGKYLHIGIRQNGTCKNLLALTDSGNLLVDPYTQKPVSMVDRSAYTAAYGSPEHVRLIPYESLGCRHGLLEAVTVEELNFAYGGRRVKIRQAVLGMADPGLFEKKPYQMILNPQVLSEEKREYSTGGKHESN